MNLPRYHLKSNSKLTTFEFVSEGPNGAITKLIQFSATNVAGIYNLAFGDRNHGTGKLDDMVKSNNGDSEKVLATVVAAVYVFTERNQSAWIYAAGSTKSRTRLYRMGINKYLATIRKDFEIYGETDSGWEKFNKDKEYEGFLVRRKKS